MGVLPPFPRVDHEFAKTRACRRQGLRFPGLDRRGFDDRNQNPFGGVVAENNVRVLVICHYRTVKNSLKSEAKTVEMLALVVYLKNNK